jgi:exopolysaccharide production protein ExoZ
MKNLGNGRLEHDRFKLKHPRIDSIQVLRAVAAISVLLFHASVFEIGYGGVDMFFVISGFIMGTIGVRERPGVFVANRLIRIVPLYWAVTFAMCAMWFIPGAFKTFAFDAESLVKSLFFIPYIDQTGSIRPLVNPGWSLNYEVFFYAVFAVGLFFKRAIVFTLIVMGVLAILGSVVPSDNPFVHTYTSPLLLEFAAGLALAYVHQIKGLWFGLGSLTLGVALFAYTCLYHPEYRDGFSRLVILGVPAILVVLGALSIERAGYWPRLRIIEAIGDASYSLYLLQGIVVAFCDKFLHLSPLLTLTVIVAICLAGARLSYVLFERPVGRLLRTMITRRVSVDELPSGSSNLA